MIVELIKTNKLCDANKFGNSVVELLLDLPIKGINNTIIIDGVELPSWTCIVENKNAERLAWLITLSKWRYIREYLKKHDSKMIGNNGGSTCGLCLLFTCNICPIGKHTSYDDCKSTPYGKFVDAQYPTTALIYARQELFFLWDTYKDWKYSEYLLKST